MKTQTNQPLVNELADLLGRAKERPCPDKDNEGEPDGAHAIGCFGGCHGTGTITDPDLQAAWELLSHAMSIRNVVKRFLGVELPDYMWRGVLEQVVETAKLSVEGPQINTASGQFRWWGDIPSLGKALKEALNGAA